LVDDETVVDLAGRPTLLLHGDTLCTDDTDYLAFRAEVRDPAWQRRFLALPLAERRRKIEGMREQSETAKGGKRNEIMDANDDAIAAAFRTHGVSRMIHGHTHRQARHDHTIDNRARERWVLGDWRAIGNALAVDSAGCRWLTIGA
jgi:UDP-2,3-diacylglucosamine hydrolase